MLTPTVAARHTLFYPIGNTPAINLARSVPHGVDADILSLGCGDLRNIFYTAYCQSGLPARKFDITCCDIDEKVIGRNIILLTLLLDGDTKRFTVSSLWNLYYHTFVEEKTAELVLEHVRKLTPLLESLGAWTSGPYATVLRICDQETLKDVRAVCRRVEAAAEQRSSSELASRFSECLATSKEFVGDADLVFTGARAAAPLSLQSRLQFPDRFRHYWSEGAVMGTRKISQRSPNPMFAGLLSANEILHYGTDPLLGYHLAAAFANLSEDSPMRPDANKGERKILSAAQDQFSQWTDAFRALSQKGRIVLRFAVCDALSLCHTLQHAGETRQASANWYRRQFDARILRLDEDLYGPDPKAPMTFDVIETSNLSDHIGALNVAVSAAPLLKPREWATIFTNLLVKSDGPDRQVLDNILCGPTSTVSLLLGLTSLPYWTNAKNDSHVDEIFLGLIHKEASDQETQFHTRLAWTRDDQPGKTGTQRPSLHMESKAVARAIFEIYLKMFSNEKLPNNTDLRQLVTRSSSYSYFHRGSLVALIKLAQTRIKTDWPAMFGRLLELIPADRTLVLGTNFIQEFLAQLHLSGVYTEAWVVNTAQGVPDKGVFKGWSIVPPTVAVTVVIPRDVVDKLFDLPKAARMAAPTLVGSLSSSEGALDQWHNMYGDVHIVWGKASAERDAGSGDTVVKVDQDELGWAGTSPLLASFTVPSEAISLEPETARVGVNVALSAQNVAVFGKKLGMSMTVFETKISDASQVLVSKLKPGQTGNPIVGGGAKPLADKVPEINGEGPVKFDAEVNAKGKILTISGRVSISSDRGKKLLEERCAIELQQSDPFVIDIVFGWKKLVLRLRFPVPVMKDGSKTKIARTSGYVEVIAPLAEPKTSSILADYVTPTVLTSEGLPVALNTPHVNLDCLPILDLEDKEANQWLTGLTSQQFSSRERRAREGQKTDDGSVGDTRVNFKESLFTMFMFASGLQGGQTGLFAITHPGKGGIHMLILVSAIRLDGDTASVVMDAAVIPLTVRLIESRKLQEFLLIVQSLEMATIKVDDAELLLWKKALPAMVERCRTWDHLSHCPYRHSQAQVPISVDHGEKLLCSCGEGQLPEAFVTVPEWDEASKCATRIAISPTFAVPFVEEVMDVSSFKMGRESLVLDGVPRCRRCGKKGGEDLRLKACSGCRKARYCSGDCQKADWKTHKTECDQLHR